MGWGRRWTALGGVCALVGSLGCATFHPRGWEALCPTPFRIVPNVDQHLREAGLHVGLRGWYPTAVWIQDQCEALGYDS